MTQVQFGRAERPKGPVMYPVLCRVGDAEYADVFDTRAAALGQALKWQAQYPDAQRIIVLLPEGEAK